MKKDNKLRRRKCAQTRCGRWFRPMRDWQKYCSTACKNLTGQERMRERLKRATELEMSQQGGVI